MSFSSTTSRALSYVSGTFHFQTPALQLTLVLSGKQIQTLLREQGVKQAAQPCELHILGKLLISVAQGSATVQKGDLPSLILATPFDRPVTFCFHSSLWPCCVSSISAGLLKGKKQAVPCLLVVPVSKLIIWARMVLYGTGLTGADGHMWSTAGKVSWLAPRNICFFLKPIWSVLVLLVRVGETSQCHHVPSASWMTVQLASYWRLNLTVTTKCYQCFGEMVWLIIFRRE